MRYDAIQIGTWGLVVVILLSSVGAFVGLDSSSMWHDELFTAYVSDPEQSSLPAMLLRAAEDVHPPGYYALVYGVTRIVGGDFAVVARGLGSGLITRR